MGVTAQTFNYMNRWLKNSHKSICELGDQQFSCCPPFQELSYTRTYFNSSWGRNNFCYCKNVLCVCNQYNYLVLQ